MATRLPRSEGLSGLWKELVSRSNFNFYTLTLQKVQKADKELSRKLKREYGNFFVGVARNFINRYSGARNRELQEAGWTGWPKLSESWLAEKEGWDGASNRFYVGLSQVTRYKATGRDVKQIAKGESFEQFMRSLKPIDVDDAMGPIVIEYTFRTPRKKYTTVNIQGVKDLAQQITQTQKDEFPEQLMITAEVKAFQNLRGTPMKEWNIVDKLIQEMGSYDQWRKINGTSFGRNGRPVRPLIGPSMTRFMNAVSLPALKQFNETLR